MKWPAWHPMGKLALFCTLTGVAVMVMGSDEEHGPASAGRSQAPQAAAAVPRQAGANKQPLPLSRVEFERLLRQRQPQPASGVEVSNVFGTTSWYVAPPPPPPALPPAPVAPPQPFTYLGHYKNPDSPAWIVILAWADRVYTVSEGDVIDGTYRIGPAAAGMLEITYLPLNTRQAIKMDGMS